MDANVLVENIKRFSQLKKVTVTEACTESGVGRSFVSDIKRGQTPSVAKVAQLAAYLGVTTSELLGEKIPPMSELDTSGIEGTPEEISDMLQAWASATAETREIISLLLQLNPENLSRALEYIRFELDRQGDGAERV